MKGPIRARDERDVRKHVETVEMEVLNIYIYIYIKI